MEIQKDLETFSLVLLALSFLCLSIIQLRATFQHGQVKALFKELDGFDKKLLKLFFSGLISAIALGIVSYNL